ncbi:hypothetical protein [Sphaerimonospora thailandensis]|uniref:hypothetical protein n=1 Tax=Sphaerimonospora thailandensis TaxID=795644 RepID=UPI00194FEBAD|nr:hypothetical protein [Sphaerimonospora thailandensis]
MAQVAYENAQRHEPRHSGLLVEESAQVLRDCLRALDLPRAGVQRLREAEAVYLEVHTHFNEVSLALAEIRARLAATRPGAVAVSARHEEMIAAGERAAAAARERLSSGEGVLSTLALHLHNLALAHIDAGHASQAVRVLEESIELYRSLAQHEPFWHSRFARGQKVLAVLDRMP